MAATLKRYFRVERQAISLLRFILEGYDGLAVLTTLDRKQGRVMFSIAPGCEAEMDELLAALTADIMMEEIPAVSEGGGPCFSDAPF